MIIVVVIICIFIFIYSYLGQVLQESHLKFQQGVLHPFPMLPTKELLWTRWLLNMRLRHALKPGHEGKEVDANHYSKILGAEEKS